MFSNLRLIKKQWKIPVFWQFIIMYLFIAVVVIAALMPLYYKALSISKESYLKENSYTLTRSGVFFENTTKAILQIPQTMKQSEYYINMKLYHSDELPNSHYFYLSKIRDFFSQQCLTTDLTDTGFIMFLNSGICISNERIFQVATDCFSESIIYAEYKPDEIINRIMQTSRQLMFIQSSDVSINARQSQQYLTLIVRPMEDSTIYGMLFSQKDLLELFNIFNLPEGTFFYIADKTGEMLFSHQYNDAPLALEDDITQLEYRDEGYSVIRYTMESLICDVVIGIPDSYFTELLTPLSTMNGRYILAAILIGIVLSGLFSFVQFLPIKKLLHGSLTSHYHRKASLDNEYHYIEEVMDSASAEIKQLHNDIRESENTLRANLFIRLLFGTVHLDDELKLAKMRIPQLDSNCLVVLINTEFLEKETTNANIICFNVYERLSKRLESECVLVHLDLTKTVVLTRDTEQSIRKVSDAFRDVAASIEQSGVLLSAGASEPFSSAGEMRRAFFQAQIMLDTATDEQICFHRSAPDSADGRIVDLNDLQKLYDLIATGETGQTRDMLGAMADSILANADCSSNDVKQVFYSVRLMLESVIVDAKYDVEFTLPQYSECESAHNLFEALQDAAESISEGFAQRKSNSSNEFVSRITSYIQENISDPSLCMENIVGRFGVSRSFLYKLMKEVMGKTVSEYIEMIRMDKARNLLGATQMNIREVAGICGYNSSNTFYKVFKKYYGITPSAYRK